MVETAHMKGGQKKIKLRTIKVKVNDREIGEVDHFQGDELQRIEEKALLLAYQGVIEELEKINDLKVTINITKEN